MNNTVSDNFMRERRIAELRAEIAEVTRREAVIGGLIGKTESGLSMIETRVKCTEERRTALGRYEDTVLQVRTHLDRINWILFDEDITVLPGKYRAVISELNEKYRQAEVRLEECQTELSTLSDL